MKILISALVLVTSYIVAGQRPSFAGTRPIGFPDTPNRTTTTPDPLGNRFGDGTPERLPIEANGDRDLVDRLSKLPIDKQPFWFINWQAYEQHRKDPQTYPQRPNAFVDPIQNSNSGTANNGFSTPSPGFVGTEPTVVFNRFGSTPSPSQFSGNAGSSGNSNFNSGGNVYPSSVYPNSNANINSNVYPNSNAYLNSNVYPNSNANLNSNVYPNSNSNLNSNVYPNSNNANLNYPTANPNSNAYPDNNGNSNNYPAGNFNNNPSGNSNTHVQESSSFNAQSHSGTLKNGVTYFQTTQKYQWNTSWKTTNVGTTNIKKYPEYNP